MKVQKNIVGHIFKNGQKIVFMKEIMNTQVYAVLEKNLWKNFILIKLGEINKSIKNKAWQDAQDEKVEKISEFIDLETGDFENCQKWELFFINQMYKNFYPEIEDSALSEQGVSTTH